jgi:curved DNA-binding protein
MFYCGRSLTAKSTTTDNPKDNLEAMAEDYYKVLGVSRNASQSDIQKAYRELARKYHPDRNPDDKDAKKKFQRIQSAFDVLNDPQKREMYDRYGSSFESTASGGPRGGAAWGPGGPEGGFPGFEDIDLSQFFGGGGGASPFGDFSEVFTQFRRPGRGRRTTAGGTGAGPRRGADVQSELTIPFNTAIIGGEVQFTLQRPTGQAETISVKIPAGIEEGKKIRLRGQGEPSPMGGTPGDLLITIHVATHPYFSRRGNNLYVRVPLTLPEAIEGARVDVPTPKGTVSLRVPPGTSSGSKLRIKGHGVTPKTGEPGDLYAEVFIVLPKTLDDTARQLAQHLAPKYTENPRADLRW